jgi:putative membrane protein
MWQFLADHLPHVTAALNATATVLLTMALIAIKKGKARRHKQLMIRALMTSGLFLAIYLFHKVTLYVATGQPNKSYPIGAPLWSRYTYFSILITHLILAMLVPFLALRAAYLAKKGRIVAHKKLVRWAFPIWMYVSVTGVAVYFFLYHYGARF